MINWDKIVNNVGSSELEKFVKGGTYRQISGAAAFTKGAGEVRKLLRTNGTRKAKTLARKALSRRDLI